jgi:osmotically-inducible protein OsmY
MRGFLRGLAIGAWVAYLFDPQHGRRRRHMLRDRSIATVRRFARRSRRGASLFVAEIRGFVAKATHLRERPKHVNDETLAQKVMSEAFRSPDAPKGDVNVNVEGGRVVLRGQVATNELIEDLERRVRKVAGVQEVENLLHTPPRKKPRTRTASRT